MERLSAYFDESMVATSQWLIVAGFVAPAENWEAFSIEWEKMLDSTNIGCFHAVEIATSQSSRYTHLGGSERLEVFNLAAQIIGKHLRFGVVTAIPLTEFESYVDNDFKSKNFTAYSLALILAIQQMQRVIGDWGEPYDLSLYVENGHINAGQSLKILSDIFLTHHATPEISPRPVSVDKIQFIEKGRPAVQAADLLAYTYSRFLGRRSDDDPYCKALDTIRLSGVDQYYKLLPKDELENLVDYVRYVNEYQQACKKNMHNQRKTLRELGILWREYPTEFRVTPPPHS